MVWKTLRINPHRLQTDFEALAQIGATPDGGVDRPALGEAHLQARAWYLERAAEAGLKVQVDAAGNHSAVLRSSSAEAPTLLLGSHLDSVLQGGRYDGPLGVLAALEVLRTIQESRLALPIHLEAIDFTDEEGTLFGLLGSSALAGHLSSQELAAPRGGREALLAGLARAGLNESDLKLAARPAQTLAGYLELHIEQGPRLARQAIPIAIVNAIVGIASYNLIFTGRANHAGTTPMEERLDASQGAAAFILAARQVVLERFPNCVVNTGIVRFSPGAYNIIPGTAELALEFRSAEVGALARLDSALLETAQQSAARFGLNFEVQFLSKHDPAPMSSVMQAAITNACDRLGLAHISLSSGAGHDAQSLAPLCPAGMLFVPSVDGISHSPREHTAWPDCLNGANVLLQAALEFIYNGGFFGSSVIPGSPRTT